VITVHRGPAGVRATAGDGPTAGEGATVTRTLESIDAAAATIAPDGRWWRAVSTAPSATTGDDATDDAAIDAGVASTAGALAGVAKVWLDEQVEAALDQSVPMVGAPAAWDAGYDGTGLTVAVLDTGIDADHPDLAGKVVAARNFAEGSTTADDLHGHGTHVAGIVAGTGAASGGTYRGVAPGVEL